MESDSTQTLPFRASPETFSVLLPREVLLLILIVPIWNYKTLKKPSNNLAAVRPSTLRRTTLEYIICRFLSCRLQTSKSVPSGRGEVRSKIDVEKPITIYRKYDRNMTEINIESWCFRKYTIYLYLPSEERIAERGKYQISAKTTRAPRVFSRALLINQRSQRLRGNHSLMAALRGEWKAFHENNI